MGEIHLNAPSGTQTRYRYLCIELNNDLFKENVDFVVLSWRYVLLHHVMGELEKEKGAWGYVEGGMGGVSQAIASAAQSYGVDIFTEKVVWFDWIYLFIFSFNLVD